MKNMIARLIRWIKREQVTISIVSNYIEEVAVETVKMKINGICGDFDVFVGDVRILRRENGEIKSMTDIGVRHQLSCMREHALEQILDVKHQLGG